MTRTFLSDRRGNAAVEFALVAPILAALFLTSYGIWEASARGRDMSSALDAGAADYMNGGADDAAAKLILQSAWQNKPTDASVDLTRNCMCQTVPLACTSLCADNSAPADYVDMKLGATDPDALRSPQILTHRVIRVR
jgi:Flp pilus assembly protein TadG